MNVIFKKSKSDAENVDSLISSFIFRFSIWSTMIYIACFLKNRNQWICNSIKCARFFRAVLTNAISKTMIVLYNFALRHVSMRTILFAFKTIEFEIFRIYTCSRKLFASILDLDARFSILENFSFNFNLQTLSRTFRHLFV